MAPSPSPEQLAPLTCCRAIAAAKGLNARYLADAAIRHYRGRHLSELLRDLGEPEDAEREIVLQGGIGTLVLRWSGNTWRPAPSLARMAGGALAAAGSAVAAAARGADVLVDDAEQARRLAVCATCPLWRAEEGRCAVCGCFTRAKARLASARCPEGRW